MLRDERQMRLLAARFRDDGPDRNSGWCPEHGRETQYLAATRERAAIVSRPVRQAECLGVCREAARPEERWSRRRNPACSLATCGPAPENPASRTPRSRRRRPAPPLEGSRAG